jgi:hypothetical protein
MEERAVFIAYTPLIIHCARFALTTKKAGVVDYPMRVFHHAGLLANGPPGTAGLPFS